MCHFFNYSIWLSGSLNAIKRRKKERFQLDTSLFKKTKHLNWAKQHGPQNYPLQLPGGTKLMNNLAFWEWPLRLPTDYFASKMKSENSKSTEKWSTQSSGHSPRALIRAFRGRALWHWTETATRHTDVSKPDTGEPRGNVICAKLQSRKLSLETEHHNYLYLKENIPKSFFLLVFVTIYLFLFAALTLFPKVVTPLSTLLHVLRIWYLSLAFI